VITEKDLQEAIAECQGERNPNANTCIKLAAYYTIRRELFGDSEQLPTVAENAIVPAYSYAAPLEQVETIIDYQSDTEFSAVIDGRRADDVWPVMEELMEVLRRTNKPLYNATIRKIQD
jgi:hypothetical protein